MGGKRVNVNANNTLCVILLRLRRHLNSCDLCRGAIKTRDYSAMCDYTKCAIVDAAQRWERSISLRLQTRKAGQVLQFLCPNPGIHGSAYALTAEPVIVTHVQDALF
jgi:hypothetical protein